MNENENSEEVMQEITLNVGQHRDESGWFFLKSDDIPGLFLFGPDLDELLRDLPEAISILLQTRAIDKEATKIRDVLLDQLAHADAELTEPRTEWSIGQTPFKIPAYMAKAVLA